LECPELKFKGPEKLGRKEYFEHLRSAKFCLAPRGESSWTLRFYESFFVVSLSLSLRHTHMHALTHVRAHAHTKTHAHPLSVLWIRNDNHKWFYQQECVPVVLSDQVELPFQDVVDYAQISIKWPSTRIGPELLEYLESIPG